MTWDWASSRRVLNLPVHLSVSSVLLEGDPLEVHMRRDQQRIKKNNSAGGRIKSQLEPPPLQTLLRLPCPYYDHTVLRREHKLAISDPAFEAEDFEDKCDRREDSGGVQDALREERLNQQWNWN
ncbi:hypothetical protein FB45DRAFT_874659 [Roridomyces roridus]|uniref:Uncharacterized protein n=1 Tax=Roridomyces roridus TaxID=1738132 RepID=A0AAD7B7X6_9AGAR|nr:hypothetical protein FB45DRAFT_874659 [Roridomyces roridus]